MIPTSGKAAAGEIETLLQQFSQTLEEANRELLDTIRDELRDLHARVGALEGELRIARMEVDTLRQELRGAKSSPRDDPPAQAQEPERNAEAERIAQEIRQRHREIWQLQSAGESAAEVAKRTNRPQGEVELIMRLMRQRGTSAPGAGR